MKILFCKACDAERQHVLTDRPDTPHGGGEWRCHDCGRHHSWAKKEKNEGKREKNKHTPESLEIDFCQMCGRKRNRLVTNETLEVHHVHEIAKGGPDTPENIWVLCTSCHSLVHHQRTYLNYHHAALWERYEKIKQHLWKVDPVEYQAVLAEIRELAGI